MSPKVSDEHKAKVQDKILQSAKNLFSRKGYHETSMDDIVKESGFSKGAIYSHFDSKESLFLELQKKFATLSAGTLISLLSHEKTALSKLEKAADLVFASVCEVSDDECRMDLEFQLASSRIPKMKTILRKQQSALSDLLSGIIKEGIDNGEFRKDLDADSIAIILISAIGGLSTLLITTGIKLDWQSIKNSLVSLTSHGLSVN
ncbi:MAG: TetR/AcrR family transcriptional regulator [Candidatus Odinarchaeota archaeon]